MKPMPQSSEGKRQLLEELKAKAPDLLAEINTLRKQFPRAKVVDLKFADGTHYGSEPAPEDKCFQITPAMEIQARRETVEAIEKARKDSLARSRRKRR